MTTPNPFLRYLDDEPRAAFFSRSNQFGRSPRQRQFFEGDFSNIYNEYLGFLGTQAREGQLPTGDFNSFLENLDFDERFERRTPTQKGTDRGVAPLRYLIPR